MSRLRATLSLRRQSFSLAVALDTPLDGVVAIQGPSGCGKTTLLRALAGLERADDGAVHCLSETWQDEARGLFIPLHRRQLGMLFQEPRLFPFLDVRGNLLYGRNATPRARRRIGFDDVVGMLELAPLLSRRPDRLSGGEAQRVALGRVLLTSPRLLFMDEPLASLDADGKQRIIASIRKLSTALEIPILYVTHDMAEIHQLADRLILMEAGRITEHGPLSHMLTRLDLPPANRADAAVVIAAVVESHDEQYHLTRLRFGAKEHLLIAGNTLGIGHQARIRIMARDVSLTLDHPGRTSILNVFRATVRACSPIGDAQYLVTLDLEGVEMLARITARSHAVLDIRTGMSLFAQVKSVALER
ncbi:MAG: molybdenum ABC transporter ATP-binding protein [Magnetococcales bacterium]|nr:molybdenum ABC transporter ATP-binding protein [Magnetococcales bacterium]